MGEEEEEEEEGKRLGCFFFLREGVYCRLLIDYSRAGVLFEYIRSFFLFYHVAIKTMDLVGFLLPVGSISR